MLAASCGVLFGFSISSMNQIIDEIRHKWLLTDLHQGVVVSALVVGALTGCLVTGALTQRLGRRSALVVSGLVATASAGICSVAPNELTLVGGRFLIGMSVGVTSAVAPVLLAELAAARLRGFMITSYQLAITVGVLIALSLGAALPDSGQWRLVVAVNAVPAVFQAVSAFLLPRTPADLLAGGQEEEARRVLRSTRGREEALAEYARLVRVRGLPDDGVLRSLSDPDRRLATAIALGAALMNALVGIGAVVYYSTLVFSTAGLGGTNGAEIASLSIGVMNFAASVIALGLIRRYGRRVLLSVGLTGMALSLCLAGGSLLGAGGAVTGPVTVGAILIYTACFAFSAGPVAWVLLAEVLPQQSSVRVAAAALGLNWGANLVVALLFPIVVKTPGIPARVGLVFVFFAVLSLLFLFLVRRFVPETKDRDLSEIQRALRSGPRSRTKHV
ncbi:sugar porter family MFS transporter [Streptomyces sp. NBC_01264]|uniref:sugar porter family MFS transporter n=1 Tax=Streptomyces sp. NBC_01264 TaxID=2903804 RepID=UPI0022548AB5|nr:sugar porter family MFS transporter [Streptomyces sp. NBC_01264]MCX4784386.1 sugar porter family MFS transporter [Streptomyces sp. NBC_01264]